MKMKTYELNGMTFELTPARTRQTVDAINETQRLLNKELSYREDLQKQDMVDFYRNHIAKLQDIIA